MWGKDEQRNGIVWSLLCRVRNSIGPSIHPTNNFPCAVLVCLVSLSDKRPLEEAETSFRKENSPSCFVFLVSVFFLTGSFCTSWLLPKLSFPKHVIEVSLHLQAQHCSHKSFCCQTKDNIYLLLLYCFTSSHKKKSKTKTNKKPLTKTRKQTKKDQIIKTGRLGLLQIGEDCFPPDFCFPHMQIIPCFVLALLSAVIKARNLFFLGES